MLTVSVLVQLCDELKMDLYIGAYVVDCEMPLNVAQKLEPLVQRINELYKKPTPKKSEDSFDFGAIYQAYPRKIGKKKGIETCRAQIKTSEDYERLKRAVENYSHQVKGSEPTFIKHFSTFMNCWQDYCEARESHSTRAPSSLLDDPRFAG